MFMRLWIVLHDNLRVSLQMIISHKLRFFLSVLGIVFGIFTLLVTLAIGEGTRQKILRTIEAMGANLVYVSPQIVLQADQRLDYTPLTIQECQRLDQLRSASAYSPILNTAVSLSVNRSDKVITIEGVTSSYQMVRELTMDEGRFLADEDIARNARVAVIGFDLAQQLFPNQNALNEVLHLWDSSFKIVGVLGRKGKTMGVDFDQQIMLPLSTLQEILGKSGELQGIWIRASNSDLTKEVALETQKILARRDLEIWDQEALLAKKNRITQALKWALGSIASVSLLIGGIGIMNVLLVSVFERVKEIGIRKAVGATSWDILFQFIFESLLLTLIGGSLGILLGIGAGDYVAWALNTFIPSQDKWEAVLSWNAIGVVLHFTFWVGLIFGLYPAWKASRLDPCEALAYY